MLNIDIILPRIFSRENSHFPRLIEVKLNFIPFKVKTPWPLNNLIHDFVNIVSSKLPRCGLNLV